MSAEQFQDHWNSWQRTLALVNKSEDEHFKRVFGNFIVESVKYCMPHGLEKPVLVDKVQDIAERCGFVERFGVDHLQKFMAHQIEEAEEQVERVPEDDGLGEEQYTERPKLNGHAREQAQTLSVVRVFPIKEEEIPIRQWIVPGLFARKQVTVLVAPSGSGKSLLTLQLSMASALKMEWAGWHPRAQYRVLIINSEDDFDEIQRRFAAAVHVMEVDQNELSERVFIAESEHYIVARFDPKRKALIRTPLLEMVIKIVEENKIDLIFVDPFAETFEGDENSNSELKWAGILWREIARRTNAGICLVHHTKKYASGMAGDVDAARGAGALIGIARIVSTLFPMTAAEAITMGVAEDERYQFIRYDDAKANLNLISPFARWFRKEPITLKNKTAELPGDQVGALVPWKPEGLFDGITQEEIDKLLAVIDRGILTKAGVWCDYYTLSNSGNSERWVGKIIQSTFKCKANKAQKIVSAWKESELLVSFEYRSPATRKNIQGCGSKMLREDLRERAANEAKNKEQKVIQFPKETKQQRFRVIGDCDDNTVCLNCQNTGNVKRIKDTTKPGSQTETLHEACAQEWFNRIK